MIRIRPKRELDKEGQEEDDDDKQRYLKDIAEVLVTKLSYVELKVSRSAHWIRPSALPKMQRDPWDRGSYPDEWTLY